MRKLARARTSNVPGLMNGTEGEYADYLELLKKANELLWWHYEGVRFRLAQNTTYTPDFLVMLPDGEIEVHEIKGTRGARYYAKPTSRVKVKMAAELYPFRFFIVWKVGRNAWKREEIATSRGTRK